MAVWREDVKFFSFLQFVEVCLPGTNRNTVKRWLRANGIQQTRTNREEQQLFKRSGIGFVGHVISEAELRVLMDHSRTRRIKCPAAEGKSFRHCPNKAASNDCSVPGSSLDNRRYIISSEDDQRAAATARDESIIEPAATDSAGTPPFEARSPASVDDISTSEDDQRAAASARDDESIEPAASDSGAPAPFEAAGGCLASTAGEQSCTKPAASVSGTKRKRRVGSIGRLPAECMNEELAASMKGIKEFYSSNVNAFRKGEKHSESTLQKFTDRVSCFLNFVRVRYPQVPLRFDAIDNADCVQAYLAYKVDEQKVCPATAVRENTCLLNLAKYVHRQDGNLGSCEALVRLNNCQSDLWKEEKAYRLAKQAGLSGDEGNELLYSHVLEVLRKLREKVDGSRGAERSRPLHDFVLIALYVTNLCGRAKELRTLRVFDESKEGRSFVFDWKVRCNVLVVSRDGEFTLYENDFKTLSTHGPARTCLSEPCWLVDYMKLYLVERVERLLKAGNEHDYVFFGKQGKPFTAPSLCVYMASVFKREIGVHATTTKLRHALVTHVMSLPESESLRLRESLATLMRHSLKYQQVTYCDRSRAEKTSLSRNLLNKSIEEATFSAGGAGNVVSGGEGGGCASNGQRERRKLGVGDLCAVLDKISTCEEDAAFFLGRIVRFSDDEDEVLLMEFRKISEDEPFYKAAVDQSWWEPVDAVISPLDIVFDPARRAYELRSSAADIYRAVFPSRDN